MYADRHFVSLMSFKKAAEVAICDDGSARRKLGE
jgi:hypothetical protein